MTIGKGICVLIEGKGLGGKKVHRVNLSLTNRLSVKLNRLATGFSYQCGGFFVIELKEQLS
jgi:hypothetical protein